MYATHVVIPDTQCKPGEDLSFLDWYGQYICDEFYGKEDVTIIHLGDHWDMPSLSSYDKGKRSMEGRRVLDDVDAGNEGLERLDAPVAARNRKAVVDKHKQWKPRKKLLRGNHEDRITRATENDAQIDGFLTMDLLKSPGWEVHDFLEVVFLDGVGYSHYFYNPGNGRPMGGTALNRLKNIGHSYTQGHQQTLDYAIRFVNGKSQHGLVCGASYPWEERYLGPQGNAHWRGLVVKHQVRDGSYDPMFVSLEYLRERYA